MNIYYLINYNDIARWNIILLNLGHKYVYQLLFHKSTYLHLGLQYFSFLIFITNIYLNFQKFERNFRSRLSSLFLFLISPFFIFLKSFLYIFHHAIQQFVGLFYYLTQSNALTKFMLYFMASCIIFRIYIFAERLHLTIAYNIFHIEKQCFSSPLVGDLQRIGMTSQGRNYKK